MNNPLNLDLRARAELLAYLVAAHLLARQMTGEWLSAAHVVESTQLWLKTNGGGADVMQRVMLSAQAVDIARRLEKTLQPAVTPKSHAAGQLKGGRQQRSNVFGGVGGGNWPCDSWH